ncbi:peptidase M20 [Veronia nyctiphanis]|uniref:Peptidase M20 n=1 Tax=Veronia nyctiphanis TaxID=1278244 RepID=A0A4Q0YL63_9GAMM|nr:M20 family metallopeptidase [Veronia nyctiphanis]RXJ71163.1 peptidase M20 [Veronia nyctiphanis]
MKVELNFHELAELILCNSYTRNKTGVDQHGLQMIEKFSEIGFAVERFSREKIGDHLLFSSPKRDGKKVLLLGHLDTVFPPDTFTDFSQDEEWIYGPGVCDMKGGNFVALTALRALHRQFSSIYNIDMLLVSDEETGSDDSRELTARLAANYDCCLVFEAAGKNHEVVIGRKGIATFNIDIKGEAAHAGNHYEDGIDANAVMAEILLGCKALTDLQQGTTVNPGKVSGGIGANTISPHATIHVEARFTNQREKERVLQSMELLCDEVQSSGVEVTLSGGVQRDVMEPNLKQSQYVKKFSQLIGSPLLTECRGGVSDANVTAGVGVPTIDGFGPFGDGDHTIHERASKESFLRRIREVTLILKYLMTQ